MKVGTTEPIGFKEPITGAGFHIWSLVSTLLYSVSTGLETNETNGFIGSSAYSVCDISFWLLISDLGDIAKFIIG